MHKGRVGVTSMLDALFLDLSVDFTAAFFLKIHHDMYLCITFLHVHYTLKDFLE